MSNLFTKFKLICLVVLISLTQSQLRKESILTEEKFSLDLKCAIPLLGVTIAEFQVDKLSKVILLADIQKNFDELGVENNEETNPERIKSLNGVFLKETSKVGVFWSNRDDQVSVTRPQNQMTEILISCALWIKDFIKIADGFRFSQPAELVKDEAKIGNKKFSYENTAERVRYEYIFQDEQLKAITQIRAPDAGLLANLIVFVNSSKILNKEEFVNVPEGVEYEDASN